MLVTGIRGGSPHPAEHHIPGLRVAVGVYLIDGVADFNHVLQIPGMRVAFKVFIPSQGISPPQNILSGSRYGYSRLSKAMRVAL